MKVITQAVNFTVDEKLVDFINVKMNKLDKFYSKIIMGNVYLKVENTSDKNNKIFEAKISVPGDEFVVKKQCKSFEEGVDSAVDTFERMLKRRKEKIK